MPIDHELRAKGLGASEISAVLGMDPFKDAYAVWCEKRGLVDRNKRFEKQRGARTRRGKYFERGIVTWYGDLTNQQTEWFDATVQHPQRSWQVCSPDAWVLRGAEMVPRDVAASAQGLQRIGGVDAKSVSWDQRHVWTGSDGERQMPDHVAIQLQWSCSTTDMPWWDVAALMGMDDMFIYRMHRDATIEAMLLESGEAFWNNHVLANVPPEVGASAATRDYLRQRFPKHVERLRPANADELRLIRDLHELVVIHKTAEKRLDAGKHRIMAAIGDAEGLEFGQSEKITWRKEQDTYGPDWEAVARELDLRRALLRTACLAAGWSGPFPEWWDQDLLALIDEHIIKTREGARKLLTPRRWTKGIE